MRTTLGGTHNRAVQADIIQEFRRVFKKVLFFEGDMVIPVKSRYMEVRQDLEERVITKRINVVEKIANDPLYVFDNKNCYFCNNRIHGKMYQLFPVEGNSRSRYSLDEGCYERIMLKVN